MGKPRRLRSGDGKVEPYVLRALDFGCRFPSHGMYKKVVDNNMAFKSKHSTLGTTFTTIGDSLQERYPLQTKSTRGHTIVAAEGQCNGLQAIAKSILAFKISRQNVVAETAKAHHLFSFLFLCSFARSRIVYAPSHSFTHEIASDSLPIEG